MVPAWATAGMVLPDEQLPSAPLHTAESRFRRNPTAERRAEIGKRRENLVAVINIRGSQPDDRPGMHEAAASVPMLVATVATTGVPRSVCETPVGKVLLLMTCPGE